MQQATTDLKIVKTAQPNPVTVGADLTYTLVVTNNSLTTATGVTVVDTLPAGFTYLSASGQTSATISGNTLTFYLGNLAAAGLGHDHRRGQVTSAAASTITNTATVSGDLAGQPTRPTTRRASRRPSSVRRCRSYDAEQVLLISTS